jgi:hypothetical protein
MVSVHRGESANWRRPRTRSRRGVRRMEVGGRVQARYSEQVGCSETRQRSLVSLHQSDCSDQPHLLHRKWAFWPSGEAGRPFICLWQGQGREHRSDDLRGRGTVGTRPQALWRLAAAANKAANERRPLLKAEQRGWIEGRNECWKGDEKGACVRNEYERRIAELQARYRLVSAHGPVRFVCEGDPANEVVATFFRTDPPTLIAERGDSVSLMYLQRSGSGSKYQGRNESLWEHQGEALITWGYGAPKCGARGHREGASNLFEAAQGRPRESRRIRCSWNRTTAATRTTHLSRRGSVLSRQHTGQDR